MSYKRLKKDELEDLCIQRSINLKPVVDGKSKYKLLKSDLIRLLEEHDNQSLTTVGVAKRDWLENVCDDVANIILTFLSSMDLEQLSFVSKAYRNRVKLFVDRPLGIFRQLFPSDEDAHTRFRYAMSQPLRPITQAKAVGLYRVPKNILEEMPRETAKNPHYKTGPPMQLFDMSDIVVEVINRFGSFAKLYQYNARLKLKRQQTADKRQTQKSERESELAAALKLRGCEIREDSRLHAMYINNRNCDWTLDRIVQRSCEMRYLHAHKKFREWRRDAQDWLYMTGERADFIEVLETIAQDDGMKYPTIFPWEK